MLTASGKRSTKQRPTISDVARLAGVSISTVSRVVNETAPVSDEVGVRVRNAIDLLGYTPHVAARNLAVRRTNTIGLLLPELSSSFFTPLLRGIEAAVRQTDYDLLIYANPRAASGYDLHRRQPIGDHNADGMLVFTTTLDDREIARNYDHGFPMVLLHRLSPRGFSVPTVLFDNTTGVRSAVCHLIDVHSRRRIVFLHGPLGNQESDERELGYREALRQRGITFDPMLIRRGGFNERTAYAAITELVRMNIGFDAVFAGDDEAAVGVLTALRETGRRVPDDIAVIGFDDLPFAQHLNPTLTTLRAPIEQAGYLAATELFTVLATGEADPMTVLPVELVIRQSCGCGAVPSPS
jgi:DNA-binding LacI/PurR family transcriptional regulator